MKRVLCVAFPEWPLQRLCAAPPEREQPERQEPRFLGETGVLRPLVLFAETSRHGLCVTCCSRAAARRGIVPGMRLAEAEGLSGGSRSSGRLQFVPHDFEADARGLEQLAEWGERFSPVVGIEPPDSLLLDVTGCGHLFGNEQGLVQQALRGLRARGYAPRLALADTIGLAWGVAHYGTRWSEIVAEGDRKALRPLPVEALRLSENVTAALHDLELRRVEQLLALPRSSLPSRFGPEVLQRLDQAWGDVAELIVPFRPPEPIEASWMFPHPTQDRRALEAAIEQLLRQVVERVAVRHEGIQRLEIRFDCGAQPAVTVTIVTVRPAIDISHLMELVLTQLEQTPLSVEVHGVRLRAADVSPLDLVQRELLQGGVGAAQHRDVLHLVDRLSNRLGNDAVVRPRLVPDAQPERAFRREPLLDGRRSPDRPLPGNSRPSRPTLGTTTTPHSRGRAVRARRVGQDRGASDAARVLAPAARPLRLFAEPEAIEVVSLAPDGPPLRFTGGGRTQQVARSWGPERIETGWWRGAYVRRDYYRVETAEGQRFWLFRRIREGGEDWFLHGEFE